MATNPTQLDMPQQAPDTQPRRPRRRWRWRRVLLGTITAVAILISAAVGGGYALLRRSLPLTDGELTLSGLQQPVRVYLDDRGVPHIVAGNESDLFFAQGFVTAQDRLFQMDLYRRLVSGRLAEVLGESVLDNDRYMRTLTLRRAAEASLDAHPPEVLDILAAYAAGVNAFIDQATAQRRLSPEFLLLGYQPEPWQPVDTLAIAKMMAWDLGGNWEDEVWRLLLGAKVGGARVAELWPEYPAHSPVVVTEADPDLLGAEPGLFTAAAGLLPYMRGGDRADIGSNNWVVSGTRTQSGKPLLANDPHLGIQMPAIWYQTHLSVPTAGLDVIGVTFPGAPGIVIGHNEHIAWGVTNVGPDVQDLYMERAHQDDPYQFEYMGEYEPATVYHEEIRVKGQADPVVHEVVVTRHGPIISDVAGSPDNRPQSRLALRWTALDPSADLTAFLYINRAKDWGEFRDALRHFTTPAQNFVFAGSDGTIGYRAQGNIPIRAQGNGMLPVPGWTDEYEWTGFIPFDALPESVNPAAGFIATANNKVVDDDYSYFLGYNWASPYRAQRIVDVLSEATAATVEDMIALQMDVTNLQARQLLLVLLQAARDGLDRNGGPSEAESAALRDLQQWDAQDRADSATAALWHAWYTAIMHEMYAADMGEELFRRMPLMRQVTDRLILADTAGPVSSWFGDRGLDGIAADALRRAVATVAAPGGSKQGQSSRAEPAVWGDLHQIRFDHPLGQVPILQKLFSTKPYAVGGSGVTVFATGQNFRNVGQFPVTSGPVWRQVVDLADPAWNSWDVSGAGQSGHPFSPYHHDQAEAWVHGEYGRQLQAGDAFTGMKELLLIPAP